MSRTTPLKVLGTVLIAAIVLAAQLPAAGRINWYDYREARSLGKEQEKKVFLYFRSDSCTYCLQMEKETLNAPEVAQFLNRHFVSSRIDTESDPSLSSEYRVMGLPTSYFIDNQGDRIGGLPGLQPSDRFLSFLRFLHTESYRQMSFAEFLKK